MRLSRTPCTGQPRMPVSGRPVRTIVVCLPANIAAATLRQCAITAVLDRGVFTAEHIAGVLPHFTARTRRASKLVDRWHGRTCGGPIRLLDLDAMRRTAVAAAAAQWLLWDQVVKGTKPANPFWWYVDKHTTDSARYPIERARADYLAQPRILAMHAHNALPGQPAPLPTPAVEALQAGYPTYLNTAWLAAVPVDGLVPVSGGWLSSRSHRLADQLDYLAAANAHLAGLSPDSHLVAVATSV